MQIIKIAPLIELTLEEMINSIIIDEGTENLLEGLEAVRVIAFKNDEICNGDIFPVTDELIYNYDFGDDWKVTITKERNCIPHPHLYMDTAYTSQSFHPPVNRRSPFLNVLVVYL